MIFKIALWRPRGQELPISILFSICIIYKFYISQTELLGFIFRFIYDYYQDWQAKSVAKWFYPVWILFSHLFYFSQIWWCLVTLLRMSTQPIWVSLSLTEILIAELRQYCLNTEVLYWTSRNKFTLNWILLHDRRNIGRQSISYQRKRFWKSYHKSKAWSNRDSLW